MNSILFFAPQIHFIYILCIFYLRSKEFDSYATDGCFLPISSYNDTTIITAQAEISRLKRVGGGGGGLNKKQIERLKENDRWRKVEVLVRVILRSPPLSDSLALSRP